MPNYTLNFNLKKPESNDNYNVEDQNGNMDLIDQAIASRETPAGAQAKVNAAITALLNGAPGALDTLKELADALGSDANFAASVTAALATKATGIDLTTHQAISASETVKGHVELATATETTAGTDNTRSVHPAGLKVELDKKLPLAGGTMAGILTAQANTSYTVAQTRNIILSTGDAVLANMQNGDLWFKYV